MSQRPEAPQDVKSPGFGQWLFLFWKYIRDFALDNLADVTITAAATGDYLRYDGTAWVDVGVAQLLTDIKTVDGTGSGLDADLLDGQSGAFYLDSDNFTGTEWTDLTDGGSSTLHTHDHGGLGGLSDDDHTQYLLASAATDRTTFAANWTDLTDAGATTLHKHDHGGMDGLADDDHTQYVLRSILTTNGDLFTRAAGVVDRIAIGTNDQVLTVVSGAPAWADAAGGGGATADIMQSTHGFAVGDLVYHNGTIYAKARADAEATAEVVGMVSAVADTDNFTLLNVGAVTGLSGLTAGVVYYLSDSVAGAMTATEPTTVDYISKPVFIASSTTAGYFFNMRGQVIGDTSPTLYTKTSGTATAGQTSITATYTPGAVEVFVNGVKLDASDYTATSGTAVVLDTGMSAGDNFEVIGWTMGVDYVSSTQPVTPQGRLTLATGTPVMSSEQAAKTSIYYTPYRGSTVPIYTGSQWANHTFSELTLALDSDSGHTGYHQSGKNFDLFVYNDSGTLRLCSGPAWSSDTARADAISQQDGIYVNTSSMTLKYDASSSTLTAAAGTATYVGTFRASANGQTQWLRAPGNDAAAFLYLWNCYNRVMVGATANDGTSSWTYATGTWRAANGGVLMRCSFVCGLNEDSVIASYANWIQASGGTTQGRIGVGLDGTIQLQSVNLYLAVAGAAESWIAPATGQWHGQPGLGFHYCEGMEFSDGGAGTLTYYGDAAQPSSLQTGFSLTGMF